MPHRVGLILGKFHTVRSLKQVKYPGIAQGGMHGFEIDWYINAIFNHFESSLE